MKLWKCIIAWTGEWRFLACFCLRYGFCIRVHKIVLLLLRWHEWRYTPESEMGSFSSEFEGMEGNAERQMKIAYVEEAISELIKWILMDDGGNGLA
ncbi:hypothetical protein EYC84_011079 [Monilinia fructicola]|uniref:Uncharacterized protein n=1 Tax=Monilinia fructicola TaxID=38448 RepID=A0A5M9J877_MONFR|nr:hypothetical protein EYC84_011079 [Monilinia fructicola]